MYDVLDTGFIFRNVELVSSIHGHQLIPLQSKASQGEGILINQSLNPHEKIVVKVNDSDTLIVDNLSQFSLHVTLQYINTFNDS